MFCDAAKPNFLFRGSTHMVKKKLTTASAASGIRATLKIIRFHSSLAQVFSWFPGHAITIRPKTTCGQKTRNDPETNLLLNMTPELAHSSRNAERHQFLTNCHAFTVEAQLLSKHNNANQFERLLTSHIRSNVVTSSSNRFPSN